MKPSVFYLSLFASSLVLARLPLRARDERSACLLLFKRERGGERGREARKKARNRCAVPFFHRSEEASIDSKITSDVSPILSLQIQHLRATQASKPMLVSARPRAPLAHAAATRSSSNSRNAVRVAAAAAAPPPSPPKKPKKSGTAAAASAALISSASLAAVSPLASHAADAGAPEAAVDGAVNGVVEVVKVRQKR